MKSRLGYKMFHYNWLSLLVFELLYKVLGALFVAPLLVALLNFSIKIVGWNYLSNDNIFEFLGKPTTLLILAILLFLFLIYIIIEIFAVVGCFHASCHNLKITAGHMFRVGIHNANRVFKRENWGMFLWILILLPVLNVIPVLVIFSYIHIPNFVEKYIATHRDNIRMFGILIFILSVSSLKWIYSFHDFVLRKHSFRVARTKSRRLMNGRFIKTLVKLFAWNLLVVFVAVTVITIFLCILYAVFRVAGFTGSLRLVTLKASSILVNFLVLGYLLFFVPITGAFVSSSYYKRSYKQGDEIKEYVVPEPIYTHPKAFKYFIITAATILLLNNCKALFWGTEGIDLRAEFFNETQVMAHRGDSENAPENTMAAFESAIDGMADWIELDVQQTKDGVIVVMHDSNLKRTTGWNRNIWNVTYDQIKDLDAGSWFGEEFSEERIVTLDEVLKMAKGKVKLNIELKPTGHEKNFEAEVVRIIRENDFQHDCMVCCFKYDTLAKIKKLDPEISTTYVLIAVYSEFWNASAADAFSMDYSFVTKAMVNNIKSAQKDIYVWTVNSKEGMNRMIDMGVDGIITDKPQLAKELILSRYTPDTFVDIIEEAEESISENTLDETTVDVTSVDQISAE